MYYHSQAPNAQMPVVVPPSANAKNVGQVPNQFLWLCPRRDWTCDSTLPQQRLWVLGSLKQYISCLLFLPLFLYRLHYRIEGFQSHHWSVHCLYHSTYSVFNSVICTHSWLNEPFNLDQPSLFLVPLHRQITAIKRPPGVPHNTTDSIKNIVGGR